MRVIETAIPGVLVVEPKKHGDERGFFSETFKASALAAHGVTHGWRQDNHSFSGRKGVVRGLHFQAPPQAQAKLLRVTRGAILDVAVDIRCGSPTFGRHVAVELSAANWRQLYVPVGMAHGFCTLEVDTEVLYKTSEEYAPETERGLHWLDPALAIAWPISAAEATVNVRDQAWPNLTNTSSPFSCDEV
ncbi:MAG: dTDP-4-dehydrorhamnose 3,5-epimerase [Hyphomonadaceae bacterium]|nr:dTDP-4-dehydrorhamnose 3,5-epimerase [Hyphomonadaceae bacterium]